MGDDIGWINIGAYHRGIMARTTPNLDQLAAEGMLFTDYYAEASCTAGRANFITGELPIRTGLTTVGQAGATVGMPAEAPTIATVLKAHGLRHRAVRQEPPRRPQRVPADGARLRRVLRLPLPPRRDGGPVHPNYPQDLRDTVGPRNLLHSFATDTDDPTVDPRWGKVGKQNITDEGPLPPHPMDGIKYNMETFDEVIRDNTNDFIDQAGAGKPFFVWMNPTRMHVFTHLSPNTRHAQRARTAGRSRKRA